MGNNMRSELNMGRLLLFTWTFWTGINTRVTLCVSGDSVDISEINERVTHCDFADCEDDSSNISKQTAMSCISADCKDKNSNVNDVSDDSVKESSVSTDSIDDIIYDVTKLSADSIDTNSKVADSNYSIDGNSDATDVSSDLVDGNSISEDLTDDISNVNDVSATGRSGRYLVYNPNGGVFKLILGWAIPVEVPMSVVWGHNFQFQYTPVSNASQLAYPVRARPKPKLLRDTVYSLLEETLSMYGLNGQACVLRTVCEASCSDISHDSLYGHLLNTILTPPESANNSYYAAWSLGRSGHSCEDAYSSCELSLLQLISTYV